MNNISEFINNSFIGNLVKNPQITDISYNGKDIFYVDNLYGRQKFDSEVTNKEVVDFLRQISNLTNTPFSIKDPILDVSFDNYRLNASFYTLSHKNKEEVVTFALRIFSKKIKITENSGFFPKKLDKIFKFFMAKKMSFIIAGLPSSGKSEFQKYLLNSMHSNERVMVIDTIDELDIDYNPNLDISLFLADEKVYSDMVSLLKLSLRYDPDYVVIAEARGSEFEEILTSSLSGIPTITTIHAKSIDQIVERCINMVQINNKNLGYNIIKDSILDHFDVLVYIEKNFDKNGEVVRKIKDVSIIYKKKQHKIYEFREKDIFYPFPEEFIYENKDYENILRS